MSHDETDDLIDTIGRLFISVGKGLMVVKGFRMVMHLSIACPRVPSPPPPGRWWGFDQGGGQMYPKSPPGDKRNGQTAPPCTRGDHSADCRRSMCPTPVTHLVVKLPTPGQSEAVKSPMVSRGGGGRGLAIDRCIIRRFEGLLHRQVQSQ